MEGKRLIDKIRLRNILSFGDKGEEIELQPLNVIIGQNASGKSNLVDVFKLLRSLPQKKGLIDFVSRNGGIGEWIWKGARAKEHDNPTAEIGILLDKNNLQDNAYNLDSVSYNISFDNFLQRLIIIDENIRHKNTEINRENIGNNDESILSNNYSLGLEFETLIVAFSFSQIYSDLQTNRKSEIRKPQLPDAPNDFLDEDGSNLALILNDFEHRGKPKVKIVENLKKFYPRIKDYSVRILGGTVQLFIREEGLEKPISAMRLSDGTLRYLCLLAILCHPEPPPLICIEEPEIGLHPDILPTIAELMIETSQRTQLIVTTHSDILVSAFSDVPEAVMVCEYDEENGTQFRRLDEENLKEWLNEYSLGELWLKGEIGGTRW